MKIKPEYTVRFEEGDVCVVRLRPDGREEYVAPLTDSAAMAWEGLARGASRETIVDAVANEFEGASRDAVARDLDAFFAQLLALGFAEEE